MKIAFFEMEDWEKEYIKKKLKGNILFFNDELNEKNINQVKDFDILSVFIYSKINSNTLNNLKKLKLIATRSTGYDHIDIEECRKRKIAVANVPYYGENTVAEHTFALILSLSRKIHRAYEKTVRGDFSLEGLRGFDLKGRTIGIIGAGHIGLHVIRIANGFEMNVLAYDVKRDAKLAKKFGFKYASLNELLKNSDIISLHAPYNKATHHLINKNNIKLIKKGSILINTARGSLVETEALVEALDRGILSGAGLDVLEEEQLVKEESELLSKNYPIETLKTVIQNHTLLKRENVIITPHNAFNSIEALQRILDTTIENIKSFMKGKIINKV
ncbi:MAG: hydroxyacid dehydrogenase [Candidatus Woesearchaeota archaeon]|nr:hydroxyacid dehydrogenase [Candidatus Woesearchaeota archaeon]